MFESPVKHQSFRQTRSANIGNRFQKWDRLNFPQLEALRKKQTSAQPEVQKTQCCSLFLKPKLLNFPPTIKDVVFFASKITISSEFLKSKRQCTICKRVYPSAYGPKTKKEYPNFSSTAPFFSNVVYR